MQLAERCHRLRLDTTRGTHHKHSAFHSRERHIDLGTKIDMPRRINKIEPRIFPFEMRHATFNRDAAFLFFGHVVHRGKALFHFPRAVNFTCRKKNPLGKSRLARIDVG